MKSKISIDKDDKLMTAEDVYQFIGKKIGKIKVRKIMKEEIPSQILGNYIVAKQSEVENYFKNYFINGVAQ